MKGTNQIARFSIAIALIALCVAIFPNGAPAQAPGWQIVSADYGFGNQRVDVTNLLLTLLSQGGGNVGIAVNNQTMSGDPAPGRDKSLRIIAADSRNQQREFDYYEGGFITPGTFLVPRDNRGDNRDDRDNNYRDRGGRNNLTIVRGYYGVQGRSANVTDRLQRMVRNGQLVVNVNNRALGIDPVIGADKKLIVIYQYRGQEQATAVPEGGTLSIP